MYRCSNCGAELREGTSFCINCGTAQTQRPNSGYQSSGYQQPGGYSQPSGYPQPGGYPQYTPTPTEPTGAAKILGLISMICGLVSLVSCMGGWAPGIAAIILSNIAANKQPGVPNSKARIGKTTGIIGTILGAICFVVYIIYCAALGTYIGSGYYYY